ncbi:ketoacyl-synt-domain-containing protein, partial [Basidiobolus meristosporus CBS 931.73]
MSTSFTPVAVIGVGCRMPGGATNPSKLWSLLKEGRSAQAEVPKGRFNVEAFYHPDGDHKGTANVKTAHFLEEDPSTFDASFFSISPNEAKAMDPQQRILMEVVYEALENGGIPIESIAGTDTGVFVGLFTNDYHEMLIRDVETAPLYQATGTGHAIVSNRISYFFDLKGPSFTLDTACSSSLVAVHLACQSLLTGESKMAIVGGTNLIFSPDLFVAMSNLHFLSPTGICHTYDKDADGYARGEGVCTVVLKPLEDAIRDGDPIRAVIRGTAVNQDGRTSGITLPSTEAQEAMIRSAYQKAGLDFKSTQYFEAHGTGTPAGDPIEASAIGRVFGADRLENDPLIVGSIKTNIGHLEGASGLAGLIKTILCLEKSQIPPNLHFAKANNRIDLDKWRIKVPNSLLAWPKSEGSAPRRASVNSFGYGGTNAHVILDSAESYLYPIDNTVSNIHSHHKKAYLIPLTSNDEASGKRMVESFAAFLQEDDLSERVSIDDLAFTLSCRRSMLPWRASLVVSSIAELRENLQTQINFVHQENKVPRVAFVFTGQGGQWWGMGRELIERSPRFKSVLQRCDSHLQTLPDRPAWSLLEEFLKSEAETRVNQSEFSQPLCTALQIALVTLWKSWGVEANVVVGHSSGEIAAAYASGVLTLEQAITVAYYRGIHMSRASLQEKKGGMIAVAMSEAEANEFLLTEFSSGVVVACINSPTNVTISGDIDVINAIKSNLDAKGVFARILKVDSAFHSHHMHPLGPAYQKALEAYQLEPSQPQIRMVSSVTGAAIANGEELGPAYWAENMMSPVQFSKAVEGVLLTTDRRSRSSRAIDVVIEVGPHSALAGPISQIMKAIQVPKSDVPYISTLIREKDAEYTTAAAAGKLLERGFPINLELINSLEILNDDHSVRCIHGKCLTDLPTYCWNHSNKYWHESRVSRNYRFRVEPRHDILGALCPDSIDTEPRWRNQLRIKELPWLMDHMVQENVIFPAAGYISMALEAAKQFSNSEGDTIDEFYLKEICIQKALILDDSENGVETLFVLRSTPSSSKSSSAVWKEFRVFSYGENEKWEENCRGQISIKLTGSKGTSHCGPGYDKVQLLEAEKECTVNVDSEDTYESLASVGLEYGITFRGLRNIKAGKSQAIATVEAQDVEEIMPSNYQSSYILHPSVLDACFQLIFPAMTAINSNQGLSEPYVPTYIKKLIVSGDFVTEKFAQMKVHAISDMKGFREAEASLRAYSTSNSDEDECKLIMEVLGLQCTALGRSGKEINEALAKNRSLFFRMIWAPDFEYFTPEQANCQYKPSYEAKKEADLVPVLEKLSLFYIRRALAIIDPKEVSSFAHHHQTFYEWMELMVKETAMGNLDYTDPAWLTESMSTLESLANSVSEICVDAKLLNQIGSNLERILRGEVEALELMLKDDLLYDFYRYALGNGQAYNTLEKVADSFAHKYPNANILEIGAGTGGATKAFLESLGGGNNKRRRFASYTFTDVSSGFFEKAQNIFAHWDSWMTYKVLDIEKDPLSQGFVEGSYDLIVAANVLHATANMEVTMSHVRKLLKPGGRLVLLEITRCLLRVSVMMGPLPGWWLGEGDGRKWAPTINESEWDTLLKKTGYSGLDVSVRDFEDESKYMCSIMMSEAVGESIEREVSGRNSIVVVVNDDSNACSVEGAIFAQLQVVAKQNQQSIQVVSFSRVFDSDTFFGSVPTVIVLAELEQPILLNCDERMFQGLQRIMDQSSVVLWLTQGGSVECSKPENSLITGLSRSIRSENPAINLIVIDLDSKDGTKADHVAKRIFQIYEKTLRTAQEQCSDQVLGLLEEEIAERNGLILIPRIIPDTELNANLNQTASKIRVESFYQEGRPLRLEIGQPGLLDTLEFTDDPVVAEPLHDDEVEIEVKAAGLNFRDITVAMGVLTDNFLGCECSGVISRVGANAPSNLKVGTRVATWILGAYCNY